MTYLLTQKPANGFKHYTKTMLCSAGFLATALLAACGRDDQGELGDDKP